MKFKNSEQKFKGNRIEDTPSPKLETLSTRSPMRLTEIRIQKSMCLNFLTFKVTAAPPRRKEFVAKPKKKEKKKCPRKLTDSGMPKVEYT